MSPQLHTETIVGLTQATRYIPKRRGRRVAPSTVWRWITRGPNGVKLEGELAPSGWFTSVEAIGRFYRRLREQARTGQVGAKPALSEDLKREARRAWAKDVLDRAGIGVRRTADQAGALPREEDRK